MPQDGRRQRGRERGHSLLFLHCMKMTVWYMQRVGEVREVEQRIVGERETGREREGE